MYISCRTSSLIVWLSHCLVRERHEFPNMAAYEHWFARLDHCFARRDSSRAKRQVDEESGCRQSDALTVASWTLACSRDNRTYRRPAPRIPNPPDPATHPPSTADASATTPASSSPAVPVKQQRRSYGGTIKTVRCDARMHCVELSTGEVRVDYFPEHSHPFEVRPSTFPWYLCRPVLIH